MSVRLGELLTKASLISPDQLKEALKLQKDTGGKLGETLIKLGFVAEEDITECLSQQFGVPSINLAHFEIDPSVIREKVDADAPILAPGMSLRQALGLMLQRDAQVGIVVDGDRYLGVLSLATIGKMIRTDA